MGTGPRPGGFSGPPGGGGGGGFNGPPGGGGFNGPPGGGGFSGPPGGGFSGPPGGGGPRGGGGGGGARDDRANEPRVNRRIRVREVRVIAEDGSQLGIIATDDALRRAEEKGLDLVEVQPMSRPPVCKIMDYGKFKYEQKRKASELKKKQTVVEVKEVKFRPKTGQHDFDTKVRHLREFIEEGNKARVTIMFRGREIVHPEIGQDILKKVAEAISDIGQVELGARMEGKQMFMIVAPGKAPARRPLMGSPQASQPMIMPAGVTPQGTGQMHQNQHQQPQQAPSAPVPGPPARIPGPYANAPRVPLAAPAVTRKP